MRTQFQNDSDSLKFSTLTAKNTITSNPVNLLLKKTSISWNFTFFFTLYTKWCEHIQPADLLANPHFEGKYINNIGSLSFLISQIMTLTCSNSSYKWQFNYLTHKKINKYQRKLSCLLSVSAISSKVSYVKAFLKKF